MGVPDHLAKSALRFSLGKSNTLEEIEYVADTISKGVQKLRAQSPVWQMFKEGIDLDLK